MSPGKEESGFKLCGKVFNAGDVAVSRSLRMTPGRPVQCELWCLSCRAENCEPDVQVLIHLDCAR